MSDLYMERRLEEALAYTIELRAERDRLREALEETVTALEWLADPARYDITVTSYAQATLGLIDRDQPGHAALAKEAGQ
jgi:hypothetical protein